MDVKSETGKGITPEEAAIAYPKPDGSTAAATDKPKPAVRYLRETQKTVELDVPIEYGPKVFEKIVVQNLSIGRFRKYMESGGASDTFKLPMFEDEEGDPVPFDVLEALMFADAESVREAAESFLSRRSPANKTSASAPSSGDEPQQG